MASLDYQYMMNTMSDHTIDYNHTYIHMSLFIHSFIHHVTTNQWNMDHACGSNGWYTNDGGVAWDQIWKHHMNAFADIVYTHHDSAMLELLITIVTHMVHDPHAYLVIDMHCVGCKARIPQFCRHVLQVTARSDVVMHCNQRDSHDLYEATHKRWTKPAKQWCYVMRMCTSVLTATIMSSLPT